MCTVLEEQNSRDDDDYEQDKYGSSTDRSDGVHIKVTPPKAIHLTDDLHSDTEDTCIILFQSPRHKDVREFQITDYDDEVDNIVKSSNMLRVDAYTPTFSTSSSSGYDGNSFSHPIPNDMPTSGTPISTESMPCSIPSSLSMPSSSGDEEDSFEKVDYVRDEIKLTKNDQHHWMSVGEHVKVFPDLKTGVIAYIGETEFSPGLWFGIILDSPNGKNDGTINGIQYFECKPKYGLFVRADKLRPDTRFRSTVSNGNK